LQQTAGKTHRIIPIFRNTLISISFYAFSFQKSKTPKEFHETPIDEILSAFWISETVFETETYGKVLFQYCEWYLYCGLSTE